MYIAPCIYLFFAADEILISRHQVDIQEMGDFKDKKIFLSIQLIIYLIPGNGKTVIWVQCCSANVVPDDIGANVVNCELKYIPAKGRLLIMLNG